MIKKIWGLKNLVFDAIEETTNLVERNHDSVAQKPLRYLQHVPGVDKSAEAIVGAEQATAGLVFEVIRRVNRSVDKVTDAPLALADEHLPASALESSPQRDAGGARSVGFFVDQAQGALNGVFGDYLLARGNHLSLPMGLRHQGQPVELESDALAAAYPEARPRVCVFVHGLATTEWCWSFYSDEFYGEPDVSFGKQLDRDLDVTSLFVRYNSGRHVSDNGQDLSAMLEKLVEVYPGGIEELTLIGHSLGGLVVRSAAHYGREADAAWLPLLRNVICIGAPNLGASLEQATNVLTSVLGFFDVPGTQVPAELLNARSAGIKDARFGYTVDEEWVDRNPDALLDNNRREVPFVDGAAYYFVAGHISGDAEHRDTWLFGDLLVRLPSAGGVSKTGRMPFKFGQTFSNMNHLHLLNHPDVYALLKRLYTGDIDPDTMPHDPTELT